MEIEDKNALELILNGIIIDALNEVGDLVKKQMKINIQNDIYLANKPDVYERTYQFIKSITKSVVIQSSSNMAETEVFSDPDKITFNADKLQHGSTESIAEYLPEILALNKSGLKFGDGWWRYRDNYFEDTMIDLHKNGTLRKWFVDALRKRGITGM
jgi:hypothetical protein